MVWVIAQRWFRNWKRQTCLCASVFALEEDEITRQHPAFNGPLPDCAQTLLRNVERLRRHAATSLLLKGSVWPKIPEAPKPEVLKRAFTVLWRPFREFPFVTKDDRAVMLACILTAAVRATLPQAPAFSYDAPMAASGKTLLAKCTLRLCGSPPAVVPECRDEVEFRKRLLAVLRHGKPGILLDNIRSQFGSAALEGFLTSEHYTDRVLGVSQMLSLPTNVLVLISGNKFHPKGDLNRRILTTRIDPKTDAPERRSFKIDPLAYCQQHRQRLVAAALILLRGFVVAGQPRTTPDRLASFEQWDDLIRQAVQFGMRVPRFKPCPIEMMFR